MNNIKFNYLYRDGSNYNCWGEVIFSNPEILTTNEVEEKLFDAFLPDKQFIASQILVPEKFLFTVGNFTEHDHCYHECNCIEFCKEEPTNTLGRSIADFLLDVETASRRGWKAFDILDRT